MTDKKPTPEIMFMMIKPDDLACFARDFQARYGTDSAKIYMEWLTSKMKSVQSSEKKRDVYIPKAGEVGDFLTANLWECNPYQFEDNTYGWMSPGGIPSVFLAAADDSDVRVDTWEILTHFFNVDQEGLFNAIKQCAKIEPSPETVSVPEAAPEIKNMKINAGQVMEYLGFMGYIVSGEGRTDVNGNWCHAIETNDADIKFLIPCDGEVFLRNDEFKVIAKTLGNESTDELNRKIWEYFDYKVETKAMHRKDYDRGFEDGRKDVNEIKLNWDVFCDIIGLKDASGVLYGCDHAFEYGGVEGEIPKIITSSKMYSDTERMKLIIGKINRIWFDAGIQEGMRQGKPEPVTQIPPKPNKPSDGKEEIPTNAQLFRYLVRHFGKDYIETEYIRDNIDIYELRSNPKRRGKKIICLARKGKMKLSRWQKIQEPFLKVYGCDLSKAHEIGANPEIEAVEGSE